MNEWSAETGTREERKRSINWALVVTVAYVLLALLIKRLPGVDLAVSGLAMLLSIFGSGFALATLLFDGLDELDMVERLALGAGLSMAVGGILGFWLARSENLTLDALLLAHTIFSGICAVLVTVLRWREKRLLRWQDVRRAVAEAAQSLQGRGALLSLGLTAALVVVTGLGAWAMVSNLRVAGADPPLTEFFLLDADGQIENFPEVAQAGEPISLQYGISNREGEPAVYQLTVMMDGQTLHKSTPLVLAPDETEVAGVTFIMPSELPATESGPRRVEFVLFRSSQPYRTLHLWFDIESPVPSADAGGPEPVADNSDG